MLEYFKTKKLRVYASVVNMNRSYNGLYGLLEEYECEFLFEGGVYLF